MDISLISMLTSTTSPAAGVVGDVPAEPAVNSPFSQLIAGSLTPAAVMAADPSLLGKQGSADVARQRAAEVLSQVKVLPETVGFLKPAQGRLELQPIEVSVGIDPSLSGDMLPQAGADEDTEDTVADDALLVVPQVLVHAEEDKPKALHLDEGGVVLPSGDVRTTPHEIEPKGTAQRKAAHPLNLAFEAPVFLEAPVFPGVDEMAAAEEADSYENTAFDMLPAIVMPQGDEAEMPAEPVDVALVPGNQDVQPQATKSSGHPRSEDGVLQPLVLLEAQSEEVTTAEDTADAEESAAVQPVQDEAPAQLMGVVQPINMAKPHKPEVTENKMLASVRSPEQSRRLDHDSDAAALEDERVFEVMDEASDELEAMVERIVSQRYAPMTVQSVEHTVPEFTGSSVKESGSDPLIQISAVTSSSTPKDIVSAQKAEAAVLQAYQPEHRQITEQVQVSIRKAVDTGNDRVVLQLDPAHLGKVEVRMEMNAGGTAHVVITAEHKATLDALQQDARYLERALQESGIKADAGAMEFNLRHQNGYQNGSGMENANSNSREEILPPEVASGGEADSENAVTTHYMVQVTDGIDIKV